MPIWLDGGLATSLQPLGLPAYTPVEDFLAHDPGVVAGVQRAFVDAGAEIVLTATFRSLPGVRDDWAACIDRAIPIARATGAEVWLSLGPEGDWAVAVAHAADRVDGVVLETFVDPDQARNAVRAVRRVYAGPLVASVASEQIPDLRDEGATAAGVNCMPASAVVRALDAIDPDVPIWAKPNGGPELLEHAERLRARCAWLGGCCGTSPERLEALIRS